MINWTYKDKEVLSHDDLPNNCTDFVYELKFDDETKYIGKKCIRSESILPAQKKGLRPGAIRVYRHILRNEDGKIITAKKDKARARKLGLKAKREEFDQVITDKPFVKYTGSSEENKGKVLVSKEILYLSSNKKTASFIEVALLFGNDVLFSEEYNNKNISGVWFPDSLEGLIE